MGRLYIKDLDRYKKWFKNAARLLGIAVQYRYITQRESEIATGETIYSKLSEPLTLNVIIESGVPKVESLKQLGWFVSTEEENLLVDFSVDTPNLQEGCRFTFLTEDNKYKEYVVTKLSNEQLYPSCIKCLCIPVLDNNSTIDDKGNIFYDQQDVLSDNENYTFINESSDFRVF